MFLIVYALKIAWGCTIYIREQYEKVKYSYSIVMNLGLILYLLINALRQINLLVVNSMAVSIKEIYINTLNSFAYFNIMVLPLIIIMAVYSIVSNVVLIKREGFKFHNALGIIFGITAVLGAYSGQVIFEFVRKAGFMRFHIYIGKFLFIGTNAMLCYFYCLALATLYCNIMAARHKPKYDKDYIIILGSKTKKDGTLTPILKGRVDKALEFAKAQKDNNGRNIVFIPSGGQGNDEVLAEAESMKNYLIENGIAPESILVENQSKNTVQNMIFSKRIIDSKNENGKIVFSTTNYHVFRSGVIANNEGIDCEGIGSKTKWYFYINALIREFIANLFVQRKQHFFLIMFINIALFVLVFIGYKYNLV